MPENKTEFGASQSIQRRISTFNKLSENYDVFLSLPGGGTKKLGAEEFSALDSSKLLASNTPIVWRDKRTGVSTHVVSPYIVPHEVSGQMAEFTPRAQKPKPSPYLGMNFRDADVNTTNQAHRWNTKYSPEEGRFYYDLENGPLDRSSAPLKRQWQVVPPYDSGVMQAIVPMGPFQDYIIGDPGTWNFFETHFPAHVKMSDYRLVKSFYVEGVSMGEAERLVREKGVNPHIFTFWTVIYPDGTDPGPVHKFLVQYSEWGRTNEDGSREILLSRADAKCIYESWINNPEIEPRFFLMVNNYPTAGYPTAIRGPPPSPYPGPWASSAASCSIECSFGHYEYVNGQLVVLNPWIRYSGPLVGVRERDGFGTIPKSYGLEQPYPNPFNSQLSVMASWKQGTLASVQVSDVVGRTIETIDIGDSGQSRVRIDAKNLASGTYFLQLNNSAGEPIGKPVKAVLIK